MKSDPYLDYLNENPILIVEQSPWEIIHVCARCEQEISKDILNTKNVDFESEVVDAEKALCCPHCKYTGGITYSGRMYNYVVTPINHKIFKRRRIYTEPQTKTWWGKNKPRNFVEELESIPNEKNT